MIYDKNILTTYCPNTSSDTGKFWLANVPWPTVICSPEILYLHFCCHLTQFLLVLSKWVPSFHACIAIKFGHSTASQGLTPKGWKEENCLEYKAVNNINFRPNIYLNLTLERPLTLILTDKKTLHTFAHDCWSCPQTGNFIASLVTNYIFLLAMATKMVATWSTVNFTK